MENDRWLTSVVTVHPLTWGALRDDENSNRIHWTSTISVFISVLPTQSSHTIQKCIALAWNGILPIESQRRTPRIKTRNVCLNIAACRLLILVNLVNRWSLNDAIGAHAQRWPADTRQMLTGFLRPTGTIFDLWIKAYQPWPRWPRRAQRWKMHQWSCS